MQQTLGRRRAQCIESHVCWDAGRFEAASSSGSAWVSSFCTASKFRCPDLTPDYRSTDCIRRTADGKLLKRGLMKLSTSLLHKAARLLLLSFVCKDTVITQPQKADCEGPPTSKVA